MRILVVSNLYPPVTDGGYEVECSSVAEHLRAGHEVLVLTSARSRERVPPEAGVRRELEFMTDDPAGARRAPLAALTGAAAARRALAWGPDLVYVWNGASIPQSSLRVLADADVPLAFRVCEHWFGRIFTADQFMRELLPAAARSPVRRVWAAGCRTENLLPQLRLEPLGPMRAAVSWASQALKRSVVTPPFVETVLEEIRHPVPRHGDIYRQVQRSPAAEPLIAFLGRVTSYKGVEVAIDALARLRSGGHPQARLLVIGPEEEAYATRMRGLAAGLGVGDAISWRGQLSPADAAAELAKAHALIVPSTWDEPFGLVSIEAALARLPVVASDVGGVGEALADEEQSLLFAPGDGAAAAAALARVLDDPVQTAARVERALSRAESLDLDSYLAGQERFVLEARDALVQPGVQSRTRL